MMRCSSSVRFQRISSWARQWSASFFVNSFAARRNAPLRFEGPMTRSDEGTLVAITHVPSPNIQRGERTFVEEAAVSYELSLRQHAAYRAALRECGVDVIVLDVNRAMPDCVFI